MADSTLQSKNDDVNASVEHRFSNGNDAAFDEIMELYSSAVQRFAYRLLGFGGEAEDVVQDVFTAALANRRKFRAGSSLKTWLFTITINICRTRNRRHLLWRTFVKNHSSTKAAPVHAPPDASLQGEQAETVRSAVGRLPGKYRDAVVLKYLEELPTREILDILKINETAFYTRLNRGRNLLQQDLAEYLENENG
ncbi:MAG: RNA polymerase sigma factor [Planctomycetota bacterium]|jgi:RNA polymerase sigma-70 factor (ECF subfamily)